MNPSGALVSLTTFPVTRTCALATGAHDEEADKDKGGEVEQGVPLSGRGSERWVPE